MAYLDSINDMYSKLYKSKETDLLNKKQQGLSQLDSQQNALTNQYQELQNTLNARKQATATQYKGLNTNLNNQLTQGKVGYYQDRNNASLNNVQNVQSIKDYMAKNNLMSSGENVDAMLRANTDLNNNLGKVYNNEQQFERGIGDQRNQYSLAEQGAYTDIDNQLGAADREKAQKIADLLNSRRLLEDSTVSDLQSYKDQMEAQRIKDIADYTLQQEQQAKQLAASRRSSGGSSGGGSKSVKDTSAADYKSGLNKIMDMKAAEKKRRVGTDEFGQTVYDYTRTYSDDDIINYAQNLGLSDENVARMLNAANIKAPVVTRSDNKYYNKGGYTIYSGGR